MSLQSYECFVTGKRYCVTYRNGEPYCVDVWRSGARTGWYNCWMSWHRQAGPKVKAAIAATDQQRKSSTDK